MDRIALQILEDGWEQDGRAMCRAVATLRHRLAESTDGRWAAAAQPCHKPAPATAATAPTTASTAATRQNSISQPRQASTTTLWQIMSADSGIAAAHAAGIRSDRATSQPGRKRPRSERISCRSDTINGCLYRNSNAETVSSHKTTYV